MKFSRLPVGACFRFEKDGPVHRKASSTSYSIDGVGPEVEMEPGQKVRKSGCLLERQKSVIELGNTKKPKS